MTVPVLSIVFMSISAIISIGVPVYLFFFFRKKINSKVVPMLVGIAGFIIFALALEGSIHRIVLAKFPLRETPALYIIYGSLMAGLFEETARLTGFKILKRKFDGIGTGLAYGIGHGGVESVLLAGLTMIFSVVASIMINTGTIGTIAGLFKSEVLAAINAQLAALITTAPYLFLFSGIERIMAICIQLALSVIVFYAVYSKGKMWLYPLAIIAHALIDVPAAAFQVGVLKNVIAVEGAVCFCTVLSVLLAKKLHEKFSPVPDPSPAINE